ncbi:MAG TPA: Ig-like domain-containing protein [Pontibacter sp.]
MKLKSMFAAMLAVAALTGCEEVFEDGNMQPDGSKPNITIKAPTTNQAITKTQGLRIFLSAFDKDEVKELEFTVKGGETNLLSFGRAMHKTAFEFDTTVAVSTLSSGTYQLLVRATDGRTNVSEQQVSFTVK